MKKYWLFLAVAVSGVTACAAVVPAELRDARDAYDRSSRGPAAQYKPAELHTAHEALLAAEKAWHDDATGYRTLDLAYVAQRKAEMADGLASIAQEEKSKVQAQGDLANAQTKLAENTKAELARTKGDLSRTRNDLQTTQVTAAVVAGQLTAEQLARRDADTRAAAANTQLTVEQQKRQDAERRAVDAQGALSRLAAVKQEERGLVITLSGSVLFRSDEAILLPEARQRLDQVADALLETKERTLVVEGHTDSQGSVAHNNDLSQRRAAAVRDYLSGRGYPSAQTSAIGYGSQRPVANNKSAEGRANNRRVEIVMTPVKATETAQ